MSTLPGRWALTIRTPIGSIQARVTFTDSAGTITGTAAAASEVVPLHDVGVVATDDGEHVTWTQSITRPLRLDLAFDVTVRGDSMEGHSRAGRLPRSAVTGRRTVA